MILPSAPTLHELFEAFLTTKDRFSQTWGQHWYQECKRQLDLYYSLNWHVFPIVPYKKAPLAKEPWAEKEYHLPYDIALRMITQKKEPFNIAVVAGLSGLVLLDFDVSDIPDGLASLIPLNMTERTPRGGTFFTKAPFDAKLYKKFKKLYPFFDTPRRGLMYCLLPPSRSCIHASREGDNCVQHDYKVRSWISPVMTPRHFSEFIEQAIALGS